MSAGQSEKDSLIGQLKQAVARLEAELSYMTERNRLLLDASSDMVFIVDRDEKFVFVNIAAAGIIGKSPADLVGRTFAECFPPDVAHHHSMLIKKVLTTGKLVSEDPPFLLPPRNLWVEGHLFPMKQPDGTVFSVLGIIRDVTERKLVERALKESEARFRQTVQQMPFPVLVCSPDGTAVIVNAAFLDMFKIPSDDAVVAKMNILKVPLTSDPHVLAEIKKAFAGATVFIPELTISSGGAGGECGGPDGGLSVELTVFPVYLRPGEIFQVAAIFKDISERKRSEEALRESDRKARTQYKSFPVPTYTWQKTGDSLILVDYNDAAHKITDGEVSHTLGMTLEEMYGNEPQILEDVNRCLGEKTVIRREMSLHFRFAKKDKRLAVTYVFVEPDLVMVHTEDITHRQKMEEEIRKAEHLESLGLLAGGIAHDFNNLLAGIFGYVGLAREYGKDNRDIKDNLDKAMVVFGQAKSLTQQLLTFSKGGAPVRRLASVSELLTDVASFVLSGTGVRPELILPPGLWSCEVDAGQLSEVFNNIIINAQQAMPGGGVVTIAAENVHLPDDSRPPLKKGDYVKIAVHDTGIGIAKQDLAKIFDPFFTTKEKGSGLGLTIAYSIIKKHEGHIEILSEPGAGTTVTIHLPASGMQAGLAAPESGGILRGKGRVLVMDDEAFVLDALGSVLVSLGYTIETAQDGRETIRRYEDAKKTGAPFDAVILDLTIPGGFGVKQVLAEILGFDASVKAIATSGYSDDPVISNPQDFGFKAAVMKPYTIEELGQTLFGVISGK